MSRRVGARGGASEDLSLVILGLMVSSAGAVFLAVAVLSQGALIGLGLLCAGGALWWEGTRRRGVMQSLLPAEWVSAVERMSIVDCIAVQGESSPTAAWTCLAALPWLLWLAPSREECDNLLAMLPADTAQALTRPGGVIRMLPSSLGRALMPEIAATVEEDNGTAGGGVQLVWGQGGEDVAGEAPPLLSSASPYCPRPEELVWELARRRLGRIALGQTGSAALGALGILLLSSQRGRRSARNAALYLAIARGGVGGVRFVGSKIGMLRNRWQRVITAADWKSHRSAASVGFALAVVVLALGARRRRQRQIAAAAASLYGSPLIF